MNDHISITSALEQAEALKLQFEQLQQGQLDAGFARRLAEAAHYAIVVFDDWLCNEFGFNRKGRGKYDNRQQA